MTRQLKRALYREIAFASFNDLKHTFPRRARRRLARHYGNACFRGVEGHPIVDLIRRTANGFEANQEPQAIREGSQG